MGLFLILLAAGDSTRLKSKIPKPFHIVNDKTLLEHSLDAFKNLHKIKRTVIVYNKKHKKYLNKLNLKRTLKIIGGKTRQESTFLALKKIRKMNCKKVLIHDSARPNPSKDLINKIIYNLVNNHAVVPVIKINDATKRVEKNVIFKNIQRNSLRFSQTPQGFTFRKIYEKHKKNINASFDDDSALFTQAKEKIFRKEISHKIEKITFKEENSTVRWINKQHFLQKELQFIAPSIDIFIDHIEYIIKLAGIDYVAIGCDYDGLDCLPKEMTDCLDHIKL